MNALSHLSLVHRFLLLGFCTLVAAMVFIGTWMGTQIEAGVMSGTGVMTERYLDGVISPHLQSLTSGRSLEEADRIALDRKLASTELGEHIVALRIWGLDGRVIYNSDNGANAAAAPAQALGNGPPASAYKGEVSSRIVKLAGVANVFKDQPRSRLIETYLPIRSGHDRAILAVADFYQATDGLDQAVRAAQLRSWAVHGAVTLAMLALLTTLVSKANDTVVTTQRELSEKVLQLTASLAQNEHLHERVNRAAARTMALNEQFLRNIATDLHDGPGQSLALASMRIESLAEVCGNCEHSVGRNGSVSEDFHTIHLALQSALTDLRAILRGLQLPEIEHFSVAATLQRAADDHQRKTGVTVPITLKHAPQEAPLPVRITLFRVLQESLANGFRHGGGRQQRVSVTGSSAELTVEVADDGPGFDPAALKPDGHFGLDWMRERVELLGGNFQVCSAIGCGTTVRVSLPLTQLEYGHG